MNRRNWLMSAAATLALATLPLTTRRLFAAERGQAKIQSVRAYTLPKANFVQVIADDGTQGWGEAGHEGEDAVAQLINTRLGGRIVGRDVFDAEPSWDRLYWEADELGPSGIAAFAISGIDNALWDLRGKLLGKPVWALIGGKYRDEIECYGSFSRDAGDGRFLTPDECAARAMKLVEQGFRTVKLRLGLREEGRDPSDDPMLPCMRAIRRAVGDAITLYADPSEGYSVSRAIRIGRALQDELNVQVYESPVAQYNLDGLKQVSDALDLQVAAGEYLATRWQFRDLILRGGVDVINPDLAVHGGITEGKKIAALAEAFDRDIAVHNARPTLLTAAHAHYLASCRTANRPQEHPGAQRLSELWRFFENRVELVGDRLRVPNAPGIGLLVDEKAVRNAARG